MSEIRWEAQEPRQRGPLLEARDVTLRFGGVTALQDVTFDVNDNELFAIIGPNGAGKTSIFNCLNGVYHPQEGTIRFEGTDVVGMRPSATANLGIARTFQNLGLFVNLNVIDNLMLGRHHLMKTGFLAGALWWGRAKREEIENRKRVEEIIELIELGPYRYLPVGMLPYGIQKRIELGRALAMEPKLLLLDEPVAGMGLEESQRMVRFLGALKGRLTIVLVEHDMDVVFMLADRVSVMVYGRIIATGTLAEVRANAAVRKAYLGEDTAA